MHKFTLKSVTRDCCFHIDIIKTCKKTTFLFICLSFTFCTPEPKDFKTIDFHFTKKSNESISNNVACYKIIPLQTSEECYFTSSTKIKTYDSKIFILESLLDKRFQILIFNVDGKFFSKINSQGRGPEEYLSINDFDIDQQKNLVSILDPGLRKLKNYTFFSEFKDELDLNFYAKEFVYSFKTEENFIVFSTRMSYLISDKGYDIYTFDKNYDLIYSALPFEKPLGIVLGNNIHLFSTNNGVSYLKPNSNQVYEIGKQQTKMKFLLDFSYDILPNKEIENVFMRGKNILHKYIYSIHYFESSKMVFTQFMYSKRPFVGLYDKTNENSIVFEDAKDPSCGCGVTFKLKGVFENSFILECDYSNIEKTLNILDPNRTKCLNPETYNEAMSRDVTSNPILLFVEFKI